MLIYFQANLPKFLNVSCFEQHFVQQNKGYENRRNVEKLWKQQLFTADCMSNMQMN